MTHTAKNRLQYTPQTDTIVKVSYDRCVMNRYGQCSLSMFGDPSDEASLTGIAWIAYVMVAKAGSTQCV